jgi:hypothetical protein
MALLSQQWCLVTDWKQAYMLAMKRHSQVASM